MRRGDVVTLAGGEGDYSGKPRPAIVIQSDLFGDLGSVVVLPLTSQLGDAPLFRIGITPTDRNGVNKASQIMLDKITAVRRDRIGQVIGRIEDDAMLAVTRALAVFLGFA